MTCEDLKQAYDKAKQIAESASQTSGATETGEVKCTNPNCNVKVIVRALKKHNDIWATTLDGPCQNTHMFPELPKRSKK